MVGSDLGYLFLQVDEQFMGVLLLVNLRELRAKLIVYLAWNNLSSSTQFVHSVDEEVTDNAVLSRRFNVKLSPQFVGIVKKSRASGKALEEGIHVTSVPQVHQANRH